MPREQPVQSYYPSARLRLSIRFEEFGARLGTPEPPEVPPQLRRGTKAQEPESLQVVEEDGVLKLVSPGEDSSNIATPQEQHASKDRLTHVIDGIIPQQADLCRNGIRTADTLMTTVYYRDLPFDPRVIRSCAVEFFLGCVSEADFQRGISGDLRSEGVPPNARVPYNVVPDLYTDAYGRARSNLRFMGWVDDWETDWPDGDASLVTLTCTDNTRLLIGQDHPPRLAVDADIPLDRAVAEYLANFPQFRGLSVEYRPRGNGVEAPTLSEVLNKQAYPPGVGPSASKNGDSKLSVWDYLTDVIMSVGLTIRMVGTTVVMQRARTLYAGKFPPRPGDPYVPRVLPNGRELNRRLMVYGSNIRTMRASRNFSQFAPTNIEVRSYNPRRKKTLIARYPTLVSGKRQKVLNPGETAEQKFRVLNVPGIGDEKTLRIIAQGVYETIGRRELQFYLETKNLGSFGGSNSDPDLLDADAGDAIDIEVKVDLEGERNTANYIQEELSKRPVQYLMALGFPEEIAQAYAKAVANIAFPTTFRVKDITYTWDGDVDGVTIATNVCNFVEVRADASLEQDEEIEPEDAQQEPDSLRVEE